ncbi:MAG TPA: tetratricopeptide repeat protein [Lysobacter sp.]|nr:tetratricopeptide repeat protein [Lysobacter sp.]
MAIFIALAATLTILALSVVMRPLWRTSPRLTWICSLGIAITAFAVYALVGTPGAIDPKARAIPQTLDEAIVQLEAQLKRDPEQGDGWRQLGQAYATQQRFSEAREAYAKAASLLPDDAEVLIEAARTRAMAAPQRRFDAVSVAFLKRALQSKPQHPRALWFFGVAQRQAGDHAAAAETWQILLPKVDPQVAAVLSAQIDDARRAAGLPALPGPTSTDGPSLQVHVQLDPQVAARIRLSGDAAVFVIARIPGGSPMPVAVEKHAAQRLPFTAMLDDRDSPMPTTKLSALSEVEVFARLSASGNPASGPGDFESKPQRVRLPTGTPVVLTIGVARQQRREVRGP